MKWRVRDVAASEENGRNCALVLYCLVCFSFSMWWQSLRAGPSLSPMYFMMISLRSSISALPSISWGERKSVSKYGNVCWTGLYDRQFLSEQFNQWLNPGDWMLKESLFNFDVKMLSLFYISYLLHILYKGRGNLSIWTPTQVCIPRVKVKPVRTHVLPEEIDVRAQRLRIGLLNEPYDVVHWPGGGVIHWTVLVLF